jgi:hypothetical protein
MDAWIHSGLPIATSSTSARRVISAKFDDWLWQQVTVADDIASSDHYNFFTGEIDSAAM